jgi:hypothetical protein|tara:strand:- start:43 stop:315 length:273 start_codon:yes stop_codon:yes gene_type:complete
MALTEEIVQDKIEVVGDYKIVHVRTATVIKKDGTEISRTFHRHTVEPNISADDLANESAEVQAICNAVHTDAIKKSYATFLSNSITQRLG